MGVEEVVKKAGIEAEDYFDGGGEIVESGDTANNADEPY